jgi:hypothetical protein
LATREVLPEFAHHASFLHLTQLSWKQCLYNTPRSLLISASISPAIVCHNPDVIGLENALGFHPAVPFLRLLTAFLFVQKYSDAFVFA